eukprot:9099021-Alexandrium_andersonii.AAC.1
MHGLSTGQAPDADCQWPVLARQQCNAVKQSMANGPPSWNVCRRQWPRPLQGDTCQCGACCPRQ